MRLVDHAVTGDPIGRAQTIGAQFDRTDLEPVARDFGIEFHHLPVTKDTKAAQEAVARRLLVEHAIDTVVLARYMQILTPDFVAAYPNNIINIHHSFLPAFAGARPYHQAHERGVKLIGATAHYVTTDLDEGPIIEQDVVRVDHTMKPKELERLGQDVESTVLNRAVRWHAEHRVFENGHRTIVLRH